MPNSRHSLLITSGSTRLKLSVDNFNLRSPHNGAVPRAAYGSRRQYRANRQNQISRGTSKGFTLLEVLITIFLLVLITGSISFTYIAILKAQDEQYARSQARAGINIALETVVINLRQASQIVVDANQAVRFDVNEGGSKKQYVYYFQGQDGSCPPPFKVDVKYDLTKTALTGGINGTFVCGQGDITVRNILPPSQSSIALSGGRVNFDLTTKVKESKVRVGTSVRPRNLS